MCLSGCGSSPSHEPEPWSQGYAPFDEMIATAIDEAREGGAAASQIALLEQAQDQGEITVEMMRDAVAGVSDCFELAGGTVQIRDDIIVPGVVWPGYTVGFDESMGEETIDLLVQSCKTTEYKWINTVYQTQPTSRQALGEYVLSQEPVLRDCLESYGIATEPDANGWELAKQAVALDDTDVMLECFAAADIRSL